MSGRKDRSRKEVLAIDVRVNLPKKNFIEASDIAKRRYSDRSRAIVNRRYALSGTLNPIRMDTEIA